MSSVRANKNKLHYSEGLNKYISDCFKNVEQKDLKFLSNISYKEQRVAVVTVTTTQYRQDVIVNH